MSKPDDIPQDVWDVAWEVDVEADFTFDGQTSGSAERLATAENIARAILAERERCAAFMDRRADELEASSDTVLGRMMGEVYRAEAKSIRSGK